MNGRVLGGNTTSGSVTSVRHPYIFVLLVDLARKIFGLPFAACTMSPLELSPQGTWTAVQKCRAQNPLVQCE